MSGNGSNGKVSFHTTELQFGEVREVDGTAVTLRAEHLSRKIDKVEYAVELGAFVLIAANSSDLIASVSSIHLVE